MRLEDVSQVLWRERELVEELLFKLEEERTLIEAGARTKRWVAWCVEEVRQVLDRIDAAEEVRGRAWAAVAAQHGLAPDATIDDLVHSAAFPWDTILNEHRTALRMATRELEQTARSAVEPVCHAAADAARRFTWLIHPVAA